MVHHAAEELHPTNRTRRTASKKVRQTRRENVPSGHGPLTPHQVTQWFIASFFSFRKLDMNHTFIQQLKKSQQVLYVVHETIEASEETSYEECTEAGGGFMAKFYAKFNVKVWFLFSLWNQSFPNICKPSRPGNRFFYFSPTRAPQWKNEAWLYPRAAPWPSGQSSWGLQMNRGVSSLQKLPTPVEKQHRGQSFVLFSCSNEKSQGEKRVTDPSAGRPV